VRQVVLEVLESNVKRGSVCYERGHWVVLAWCESPRDIAQLTRILTQLCAANRAGGGGVAVVLTQQVRCGWLAWVKHLCCAPSRAHVLTCTDGAMLCHAGCSAASWKWSSCSERRSRRRTATARRSAFAASNAAWCCLPRPAKQLIRLASGPVVPPVQFVFRQGSPLDPAALRMVAARDARSVIVCSDNRWLALVLLLPARSAALACSKPLLCPQQLARTPLL
jgi:hypothetical protein